MKYIHPAIIVLFCGGLVVAFSSCSKSDRKPVYPVHGQVFDKDKKSAVGALVIFHPVDESSPKLIRPLAHVDEKGDFALTTYENNDGAPAGEYIITISWRQQPSKPSDGNKAGPDRLKGAYSNPKTSKLKFTITKQPDNAVPPIYLQ